MLGIKKSLILFFLLSFSILSFSQQEKKPKLVVGIVLENFNQDYLKNYYFNFGEEGFKRLMTKGAYYNNASYPYLYSLTGVDHASIYTGCTPSEHGIISHAWYNRITKTSIESIASDKNYLSGEELINNYSPNKLLQSSIGDELKRNNTCSRVFSVAIEDESAIMSSGHKADAAYWFSTKTGKWRTSSYYMESLTKWVKEFNKHLDIDFIINRGWYPLAQEQTKKTYLGLSKNFFHDLAKSKEKDGDLRCIKTSPYANSLVTEFAKNLIINENLGRDNDTDILNISYSFLDGDCDKYAIDADEKKDVLYRLDAELENLFLFLDEQVGKDEYIVMLTVSEAMTAMPEELEKQKMPNGYFNPYKAVSLLKSYLNISLGSGDWILSYDSQQIYLNRLFIEKKNIKLADVQNLVVDFLIDFAGVAKVIPSYNLCFSHFPDGKEKMMYNSYNRKLSGDVLYSLYPGWTNTLNDKEDFLAKYSYKRKVPLFFYGSAIEPKLVDKEVSILDIVPSLSVKIGIPIMQDCTGEILDF